MRIILCVFALLLAAFAFAGSRARESGSAPPTATTDGVSMVVATGCRVSVRVDAGSLTAGTIIVSYYDPVLGWVESASTMHCVVAATRLDGGVRTTYVCPDIQPVASFGRIAAHSYGITQDDGGPVKTRIECFDQAAP